MPTHMRDLFSVAELSSGVELSPPLPFTKGCPVLKIPSSRHLSAPTLLFDLAADPGQLRPLADPALEAALTRALAAELRRVSAPPEQVTRLGLPS